MSDITRHNILIAEQDNRWNDLGLKVISGTPSTIKTYIIKRDTLTNDNTLRNIRSLYPELYDTYTESIYLLAGGKNINQPHYYYVGKSDKSCPMQRPISHLTDKHGLENWGEVLIFIHNNNFDHVHDLFETMLYESLQPSTRYIIGNGVTPTTKYKGEYTKLHTKKSRYLKYSEIMDDIESFVKYEGYNIFKTFNNVKFEKTDKLGEPVYAGTVLDSKGKENDIWVPIIVTPKQTVENMVHALIEKIQKDMTNGNFRRSWSEITFFDIGVKGECEFLIELYKQLKEKLCPSQMTELQFNNTILNNLYGVCLSKRSAKQAQTLLYGRIDNTKNVRYIGGYVTKLIEEGKTGNCETAKLFGTIFDKKDSQGAYVDMKFDVVIGNPPYQDSANRQIYPYFMLSAYEVSKQYICMIVKNDWLNAQDQDNSCSYTSVRENTLRNKTIYSLVDYPNYGEVFANTGVSVCYYIQDKNYHGDCHYTQIMNGKVVEDFIYDFSGAGAIIKSKTLLDIFKRVTFSSLDMLDRLPITNNPFGFDTTGVMNSNDMVHESTVITNENCVKLMYAETVTFINPCIVRKNSDLIQRYKVCCSKVITSWKKDAENILERHMILGPNEVCTGSWTMLNHFESRQEAENFNTYMKTQFARALIKAGMPGYKRPGCFYFRFCPLQDFTSASDIDWSQSVADIDRQLYTKYNLTPEEIAYIERTIKPME